MNVYARVYVLGIVCTSLAFALLLFPELALMGGNEGGKVDTVTRPRAGFIDAPQPPNVTDARLVEEISEQEELPEQEIRSVSCENLLVMVGARHTLPPDYVPSDLVYLSAYGIRTRGAEDMLRLEAAVQLGSLIGAAAQGGEEVLVASGYRSYTEQAGTFAWFKEAYGEEAGKLSVPPGQSEHQLGTAVDFTSSDVNYELVSAFAETSAGVWLAEHAAEYGFIMSYSEAEESKTGVRWEPWHYRYVGVENAQRIEASGDGLTDFLAREGFPRCYAP